MRAVRAEASIAGVKSASWLTQVYGDGAGGGMPPSAPPVEPASNRRRPKTRDAGMGSSPRYGTSILLSPIALQKCSCSGQERAAIMVGIASFHVALGRTDWACRSPAATARFPRAVWVMSALGPTEMERLTVVMPKSSRNSAGGPSSGASSLMASCEKAHRR